MTAKEKNGKIKLKYVFGFLLLLTVILSPPIKKYWLKDTAEITEKEGITIIAEESVTPTGGTFVLINETEEDISFGFMYRLEVNKNGTWKYLYVPGETPSEIIVVEAGGKQTVVSDWKKSHGKLPQGRYRYVRNCGKVNEPSSFSAVYEFEIK